MILLNTLSDVQISTIKQDNKVKGRLGRKKEHCLYLQTVLSFTQKTNYANINVSVQLSLVKSELVVMQYIFIPSSMDAISSWASQASPVLE